MFFVNACDKMNKELYRTMDKQWFNNKNDIGSFINYELDELHNGRINEMLFKKILKQIILWDYTEYFSDTSEIKAESKAKYFGCKYWSEKAILNKFDLNSAVTINGETFIKMIDSSDKDLIHEHIIPRNIIINDILMMRDSHSSNKIIEYLDKYASGCVISKEEDSTFDKNGLRQKLPKGFDSAYKLDNRWARYLATNINAIYKCEWKRISGNGWQLKSAERIEL